MTTNQQAALRRLTNTLDHRYTQMNGELCDTIGMLERLLDTMDEGSPVGDQVHVVLSMLVVAANAGAELQSTVGEILHKQLAQARSAKVAYSQGWDARLLDLLVRATPEQAAVIRTLLVDSAATDDEIPF